MLRGIALVLFGLALLYVVGCIYFVGCSNDKPNYGGGGGGNVPARNYAPAIEAVVAQAERAGKEAERSHSSMSTSKTLKKVRDAYQAIDLRECPADFRLAFLSYITTIDNFVPFSEKYDDISFYSAFVNTTEFFTQGPRRLPQVVEEGKRLQQSLHSARQKVKEVGLNYKANVNFDF